MKQSYAQQHSRHRDQTPSVIQSPPPKPPIAVKRLMEIVSEARFAHGEEPEPYVVDQSGTVTERTEIDAPRVPRMSRQARRKALRAEVKAQRRLGNSPERVAPSSQLLTEAVPEAVTAPEAVTIKPIIAVSAPIAAASISATPIATALIGTKIAPKEALKPASARAIPQGRSLATARPRGLALLAHKVRSIFIVQKIRPVPSDKKIASQLRTLQADLATLQKSIDRLIEGTA